MDIFEWSAGAARTNPELDEFHLLQPELLRSTFSPPSYAEDNVFTGSDLNLYYDSKHTQWYKRPD